MKVVFSTVALFGYAVADSKLTFQGPAGVESSITQEASGNLKVNINAAAGCLDANVCGSSAVSDRIAVLEARVSNLAQFMKGEHGYNASTTYSGCAAGYAGADCQTDIDECLATPCQNSGVCATPNPNSFTCACTAGFGGPTCETPVVIPATFDGWVRRRPLDTADNSYYRMADGTSSYGHSAFPYARCSTNSHTHWCGQSCSESSGNWCSGHDLGGGETVGGSPNCRRSDECRNMQAIQPDSMGSGLTCRRHGWATQDDDSSTEYVIGADGCANKITLGSFNDQAMGLRGYSIQFGQACTGSVTFTFKCNGGPTDQHTVDCGTTKNFFSVYDGRQSTASGCDKVAGACAIENLPAGTPVAEFGWWNAPDDQFCNTWDGVSFSGPMYGVGTEGRNWPGAA